MKTYHGLKRFYTQGTFYGLDESVHVHTLADRGRAVINAFDLCDEPTTRDITFDLADIGLHGDGKIDVRGAEFRQEGSTVMVRLNLPASGTALAEIGPART